MTTESVVAKSLLADYAAGISTAAVQVLDKYFGKRADAFAVDHFVPVRTERGMSSRPARAAIPLAFACEASDGIGLKTAAWGDL
jgi:hypothetical protein